jgi:hypothetical protein
LKIEDYILRGGGFLWLVCQLTHSTQKTVREDGLNITEGMNSLTKMAAMGNKQIGEAAVTGNSIL